jgi:hypothetical protein
MQADTSRMIIAAAILIAAVGLPQATAQTSDFDRALGITQAPVTKPPVIVVKSFLYNVPMANCLRFGDANEFQLEWQLRGDPHYWLEVRFTADSTRGFTGLGFEKSGNFQIVSGEPVEQLDCARSLYDTFSPYSVDGDVFPNYPELPANLVNVNASHAVHYVMRNISVTAARMLERGVTMTTNVTMLWAYEQSSLFKGACYLGNADIVTEMATFRLVLGDNSYLSTNGECKTYPGKLQKVSRTKLGATRNLLGGERHQSTRVALLLFGGDLLVRSGRAVPTYNTAQGYVKAGDNVQGVCQSSLTTMKIIWSGFTDPIGGITDYVVSVGTKDKPNLYIDRASALTNLAYSQGGLTLKKNTTFIVTVAAYNFATLYKAIVSKPVFVLNGGAPVFGKMYDGAFGITLPLLYQRDTTQLKAHWKNWLAEDHSVKNFNTGAFTDNGYDYAVGVTGETLNSVVGWTHVATFQTQRYVTGLSLTHGKRYSISVRATNCAGATTTQTSPGVLIDVVPPTPGRVLIGNSTTKHQAFIFKSSRFQASWSGFQDTVSGIRNYMWAMSTRNTPINPATNQGMIMGWTDVGRLLFARNGTLSRMHNQNQLTVGSYIYVHVKAFDNAGNYMVASSNRTRIAGF